jgi:hypothetical protein
MKLNKKDDLRLVKEFLFEEQPAQNTQTQPQQNQQQTQQTQNTQQPQQNQPQQNQQQQQPKQIAVPDQAKWDQIVTHLKAITQLLK